MVRTPARTPPGTPDVLREAGARPPCLPLSAILFGMVARRSCRILLSFATPNIWRASLWGAQPVLGLVARQFNDLVGLLAIPFAIPLDQRVLASPARKLQRLIYH